MRSWKTGSALPSWRSGRLARHLQELRGLDPPRARRRQANAKPTPSQRPPQPQRRRCSLPSPRPRSGCARVWLRRARRRGRPTATHPDPRFSVIYRIAAAYPSPSRMLASRKQKAARAAGFQARSTARARKHDTRNTQAHSFEWRRTRGDARLRRVMPLPVVQRRTRACACACTFRITCSCIPTGDIPLDPGNPLASFRLIQEIPLLLLFFSVPATGIKKREEQKRKNGHDMKAETNSPNFFFPSIV